MGVLDDVRRSRSNALGNNRGEYFDNGVVMVGLVSGNVVPSNLRSLNHNLTLRISTFLQLGVIAGGHYANLPLTLIHFDHEILQVRIVYIETCRGFNLLD